MFDRDNHRLLSISLLCSGRSATTAKCLASLDNLRQAVPSELVIVDTGCDATSRGIIENYADKIVDFTWCNDFSKARNAGLKECSGQWFMFLDDDEWFEDTAELENFFLNEQENYDLVTYIQRNYDDREGTSYNDDPVARIIRRTPQLEFIYSIHEVFNIIPDKMKYVNSYVHHYGYVFDSPEEKLAHSMRNITLLEQEVKDNPTNLKHALQLAKEYEIIDNWQQCYDISLKYIEIAKQPNAIHKFCTGSFYVNVIDSLAALDRKDEIIPTAMQYIQKDLDPMSLGCIYGQLTAAYLNQGDSAKVVEYTNKYLECYKLWKNKDSSVTAFITSDTAEGFSKKNATLILYNGTMAAIKLGDMQTAMHFSGFVI